ncbi:MAG: efflux RND transporter permease subunit [Deltaproteobacteria bacterium]|nr:efflux RND transporter permease subunit [Deltaproteobacteria bacterium]
MDRGRLSRYSLTVADVQEFTETAVSGKATTEIIEGQPRVKVVVRFPEARHNSTEAIGNILVTTPGGGPVPLAVVALGGLFTATRLTLVVLPVLYQWFPEPETES